MKRMVVVNLNCVWYTIDSINKGLYGYEKTAVIRFAVYGHADDHASVRLGRV